MASIYDDLRGVYSPKFRIGDIGGIDVFNNSGVMEFVDASGVRVTTRGAHIKAGANLNDLVTFLDAKARVADIEFSFDGSSPPTAGANNGKFGICHTSGGEYSVTEVYYDNGSELILIPSELVKHITTAVAVSGTIQLLQYGFYTRRGASFMLTGDGTPVEAGKMNVISIPFTKDAVSAILSTKPIGSLNEITRLSVVVTEAFDGTDPSIDIVLDGTTPLSLWTCNRITTLGQYENREIQKVDASSSGNVSVTLSGGGSTTGAGFVYVFYGLPFA